MARFSPPNEKTFRRHAARFVDWLSLSAARPETRPGEWIGAFDCSFIPKRGTKTFGLDTFWSCCHHKAQRGVEISLIAAINLTTKCCLALEVSQTPAGPVAPKPPASPTPG